MSKTVIHPTAIVDSKAELDEGVQIGPNAIIEAGVTIGRGTSIGPHVHIQGTTRIGPDNVIMTGAILGFPPQFVGFNGAPTRLEIGARNVIREYVSIHRALNDESVTIVGDDNFLMGFSHVAHDCHVGSRVIMANGALLGGHVHVGDKAFLSGNVAVHQFCRIGRLAMIAGVTRVTRDVPPFVIAEGSPARIRCLNVVGLRRAGIPSSVRTEIERLLREIFWSDRTPTKAVVEIDTAGLSPEARELVEFFHGGKRGVTMFSLARDRAGQDAVELD